MQTNIFTFLRFLKYEFTNKTTITYNNNNTYSTNLTYATNTT